MVTSGVSYAVHYELGGRAQDGLLQDFSRIRIDTSREQPVLYVAMATWIPKCNMYHQNNSEPETIEEKTQIQNVEDIKDLNQTIEDTDLIAEENTSEKSNEDVLENIDGDDDKVIINNSDSKAGGSKDDQSTKNLEITPKKVMSPKHLQKKLESEKKRLQKQQEREEKEKKKNEERERLKNEKLKQKQKLLEEKQKQLELKQKEKELKEEQKRKEKEEKEQKRKEKEERDEQKRKEREQEKLKRQQEIDEKNKEKLKLEEQKQKAAAVFVNFFVPKKSDNIDEKKTEEHQSLAFMPFEVKSDMKLPPARRPPLSHEERETLRNYFQKPDDHASYLLDLKAGKSVGRGQKTWPFEDSSNDVTIIEEDEGDLGETIYEDSSKAKILRAKYLKFHENRRPAYYGTWRKQSKCITARRPFAEDTVVFDYEIDSDDDWEEEEQGESLNGSDDEDKENEVENDDYEVDNEFFVPHGHLSDDEMDDEETARLSPESLKQKLKLLKDEFDQDMQSKTHKIKPRSIGCVWYNKDGNNVDLATDRYLQPLAIISNGQIMIRKRNELSSISTSSKKRVQELKPELVEMFLKTIHGKTIKKTSVVNQFMTLMTNNGFEMEISKTSLVKNLSTMATWRKCNEDGPMKNKYCWCVNEDVREKYNVDLALPNKLES